jgi:hypothetical protein
MAKHLKAATDRARSAWPFIRRALAGLIVVGWLCLYLYWLAAGIRPDCHVTVVSQRGQTSETTTTRSCDLPGVSGYIYVIAVVAILLLPDMQRVKVGGVEFERLRQIAEAAGVAQEARRGDVVQDSVEAQDVLGDLLRGDL